MSEVIVASACTAWEQLTSWENLLLAWRKAARGKRGGTSAARFEFRLADELLALQQELRERRYQPGAYVHFYIHEPKRRKISAAPCRDRVVHHALCNLIEPLFERRFIFDSYANRPGKGTHRAIDRLQQFARRYRYVLRLDIVKHFPCIDHRRLYQALARVIEDDKAQLWEWRQAVEERLAGLRLRIHPGAQATPVTQGIPWLGFVVYRTHIRVKARKVRDFDRGLRHRWNDYCEGRISFAEFDASVQGWINHVGYADSWGLRRELLGRPLVRDSEARIQ